MEKIEKFNQIIDEAYKSYQKEINRRLENWISIQEGDIYEGTSLDDSGRIWTQEEFINKCKTNPDFSEKWGLKIEERELTLEERKTIYENEYTESMEVPNNHWLNSKLTTRNIPTKLITMTYKDTKIESYE